MKDSALVPMLSTACRLFETEEIGRFALYPIRKGNLAGRIKSIQGTRNSGNRVGVASGKLNKK